MSLKYKFLITAVMNVEEEESVTILQEFAHAFQGTQE
eukprot:CAMPEP_0196764926 /NCGR_PEP_ID=MMETSP1095-20130614/7178_1 /TAXON_ID=96789 ORGANISM="Chromulina nebulosa, Strain UTEXLB2642" /NCGR_SAMPLE_ID=MMETSP1095 /ASSEMBLY_ACC=CAM_ASM_000446 /LENGTH=36 /DNA_ID= /DNA_START= /DNA_END= /DNA_ORIENTATION=